VGYDLQLEKGHLQSLLKDTEGAQMIAQNALCVRPMSAGIIGSHRIFSQSEVVSGRNPWLLLSIPTDAGVAKLVDAQDLKASAAIYLAPPKINNQPIYRGFSHKPVSPKSAFMVGFGEQVRPRSAGFSTLIPFKMGGAVRLGREAARGFMGSGENQR
jgi:hypothetical protein